MANTSAQLLAEQWVVSHFLPDRYDGLFFEPRKLKLVWGGEFAFDAVSSDGKIVVLVSTSAAKTASGKQAIAKFQKLKADALYLLNVKAARELVMVFCDDSMQKHFIKERERGRFPPEIKLHYAKLPADLQVLVHQSRQIASAETSPQQLRPV